MATKGTKAKKVSYPDLLFDVGYLEDYKEGLSDGDMNITSLYADDLTTGDKVAVYTFVGIKTVKKSGIQLV